MRGFLERMKERERLCYGNLLVGDLKGGLLIFFFLRLYFLCFRLPFESVRFISVYALNQHLPNRGLRTALLIQSLIRSLFISFLDR